MTFEELPPEIQLEAIQKISKAITKADNISPLDRYKTLLESLKTIEEQKAIIEYLKERLIKCQ